MLASGTQESKSSGFLMGLCLAEMVMCPEEQGLHTLRTLHMPSLAPEEG